MQTSSPATLALKPLYSIENLLNLKNGLYDISKFKLNQVESSPEVNIYSKKYFFKKLGIFDSVLIHHFLNESKITYHYSSKSNSRPAKSIKKLTNQLQKIYGQDERNLYRFRSTDMEELTDKKFTWIGRRWINLEGSVKSIELSAPAHKGISMTLEA